MSEKIAYQARTAVVTGAASGIGRALAVALAARGAHLALSDVDTVALEDTARMCSASPQVKTYALDVADRHAVLAHADQVVGDFGSVQLVVNNAGVAVAGSIEETTFEDFDWLLGINLFGVINGTKAFLPHLIASGDGHLVNLSSVFGLIAPAYNGAYCTSKFAVRGFTECLRQELLATGQPVTVHSVHPGGIRTNIARSARIKPGVIANAGGKDLGEQFDRIARTRPERAAKVILAGVDANRARILIGPDAWVIDKIPRLLGPAYIGLFARGARRAARST